jgi:large subunit ribosomal protein L25
MEENVIRFEPRTEAGSRQIRRLRDSGFTPAVLYGREIPTASIRCPAGDLKRALRHGAHLVTLSGPDGSHKVLVKDIQYHHLGNGILHVDFHKISLTEKIEIEVPLILKGVPEGVTAGGGVLEGHIKELKVRCLPEAIPDRIEVDVSKLKLGERIRLREIAAPSGIEFMASGELVLAGVVEAKEEPAAATAEAAVVPGPSEPEVIKKGKQEEEAAAEGPKG